MEQGEYERFFYHRPGSNILMGFIRNPAQRMADGVFLGFQHSTKNPAIDKTDFKIEIDYYKNVDWPWVDRDAAARPAASRRTINVPATAPSGMYEGSLVASNGADQVGRPGRGHGRRHRRRRTPTARSRRPLTFGGTDVAAAQADQLYNNGSIFGANDWTWRQESGDWRFFYYNVAKAVPDGTLFLADTTWDDPTITDLDTLLFGPTGVPHRLGSVGLCSAAARSRRSTRSAAARTRTSAPARGRFNTSTGGPEEVVAAPASAGPARGRPARRRVQRRQVQRAVHDDARRAGRQPDQCDRERRGRRHGLVRRRRQLEPRAARPEGRRVRAQPAEHDRRAREAGRPGRVRSEHRERQGAGDPDRRPRLAGDVHAPAGVGTARTSTCSSPARRAPASRSSARPPARPAPPRRWS